MDMKATNMSTAVLARVRRDLPHQERPSISNNHQFLIHRVLHIPGRTPLMTERCAGAASSAGRCKSHAPGPPAGAARPFTKPTSRSAVQELHKDQVAQLLRDFGVAYSPAWSVDEMKQVLKDNMFPTSETAAQLRRR